MDIFAGDKGGGGGAGECCFQTMQTPRETVTPYQFKKKERQKERKGSQMVESALVVFFL